MTTTKAQEKFVTINNLRLRYLEWGTVGKTPLVCLHGFSEQAHVFDEFAEAMARHYHVYALELRGHGDSQWAADGYERDRYVDDVAAFLDAMALQKVVLVGQSLGGMIAMLYAPEHPDRVERVVLVDIGPEAGANTAQQRTSRPPRPSQFETLEDAYA